MAMPMTLRELRSRELVTHGLQIAHNDNDGSFPTSRIVMSLPQLLQLTDLIILIILFTYNSQNHRAFLSK